MTIIVTDKPEHLYDAVTKETILPNDKNVYHLCTITEENDEDFQLEKFSLWVDKIKYDADAKINDQPVDINELSFHIDTDIKTFAHIIEILIDRGFSTYTDIIF